MVSPAQEEAKTYAETIVPKNVTGMMGNDYVRKLVEDAYLAGKADS